MVEFDVTIDPDDLVANVVTAVVVVVAFADVVFEDDYIVAGVAAGVAADVVIAAGLVDVCVNVAVDDAKVPAVIPIDTQYLSNCL